MSPMIPHGRFRVRSARHSARQSGVPKSQSSAAALTGRRRYYRARRGLASLTVSILPVLGLLALAPAAYAYGHCPPNAACLYEDVGYQGRIIVLTSGELDLARLDFGDKTSSVRNGTSLTVTLFDDVNFHDRAICIQPHNGTENLGHERYKFNDKASSVSLSPGC